MNSVESIKITYHTGYCPYEESFTETLYIDKHKITCKRNNLDKSIKQSLEIRIKELDELRITDSLDSIVRKTLLLNLDYFICDADTADIVITTLDLEGNKKKYKITIPLCAHEDYSNLLREELLKYLPYDFYLPSFLQPYVDDEED